MSFKEKAVKALTPDNTEEVKPGLFVQKMKKGYRQIQPIAWKGEFRTKEQLATVFSLGTFVRLGIIIFIVWAYLNDTAQYRGFYNEVTSDTVQWCQSFMDQQIRQDIGIDFNFTQIEIIDGTKDTSSS